VSKETKEYGMAQLADIGLIGLAVMGQNLVLNMNDKGYTVAVYNRTAAKTEEFVAGPAKGRETIIPAYEVADLVASLKRPRRIMLMVKAGAVVDAFIDSLLPHLEAGDIIIDGGNSHCPDSIRRTRDLADKGILFVGTGVSGGEEGARHGPSIMPGGNPEAWPHIKDIFQATAAKTPEGEACADWVGAEGAGHYVKMVHNGIEYGDMQLIGEAYQVMKYGLGMSNDEMHATFSEWNRTELDSYLIEITADILAARDEAGGYVVDTVLDAAGQKGTGKWTGINALDEGIPVTLIVEAVFARSLSALKEERVAASAVLHGPAGSSRGAGGGITPIKAATGLVFSRICGRPFSRPSSSPTLRGLCLSGRRAISTDGTSTTATLRCSGAKGASSAAPSLGASRTRTGVIQTSPISCWTSGLPG
jgi:6-phosphogluconate dehydrogenase